MKPTAVDKKNSLDKAEVKDDFSNEKEKVQISEQEQKLKEKEITEYRKAIAEQIKEDTKERQQPSLKAKQPQVLPQAKPKSRELIRIEEILEEDLGEVYLSLPQNLKKEFKTKGEQTAIRIELAVRKTKVKVKEIVKLIIEWLKIIPGVNRYFLEQEAKIKTDKILKLKK